MKRKRERKAERHIVFVLLHEALLVNLFEYFNVSALFCQILTVPHHKRTYT